MSDSNMSSFDKWLKTEGVSLPLESINTILIKGLNSIGAPVRSIYEEDDRTKILLLTSELAMKRDLCGIEAISEYEQTVRLLVYYAEYLKKKDSVSNQDTKLERDKTEDALTVAYYLSRANKDALQALGFKKFTEAFKQLSKVLEQKPSTIKNMRDEFDPYFDNGRVGWYQKPLQGSRKEVFDKYANVSDSDLLVVVKDIINSYSENKNEPENDGHKRIKISSNSMKEFKAKK